MARLAEDIVIDNRGRGEGWGVLEWVAVGYIRPEKMKHFYPSDERENVVSGIEDL